MKLQSHAKSIHCNTLAGPSDHDITVADGNKLMQKARGTKRRRLEFFNSEDGILLRLKVGGAHSSTWSKAVLCASWTEQTE